MSLSKRKTVKAFYTSGFCENPEEIKTYLHPDAELFWNSSEGFKKMTFGDIVRLSDEMGKSFDALRAEVSHVLKDKNDITIRLTYHVRTIENPDEEILLGHLMAIWTISN
jgi:hypothetical protein